jgi:hypothetical protein
MSVVSWDPKSDEEPVGRYNASYQHHLSLDIIAVFKRIIAPRGSETLQVPIVYFVVYYFNYGSAAESRC